MVRAWRRASRCAELPLNAAGCGCPRPSLLPTPVWSSLLLLLAFLDNPYHGGVGSLKPVAMEGTLKLLNAETDIVGRVEAPCDEAGSPRS